MKLNPALSTPLVLALVCLACPAPAAQTNPSSTPATITDESAVHGEITQSTFVIPATAKDGRNPFFPNSTVAMPAPSQQSRKPTVDVSSYVLNGITSPPKRTAMINGRTFEQGEEGEVRIFGGAKSLVKCIEIKDDCAIISVNGQQMQLKMRAGL